MSTASSHFDIARFGSELIRWSPRQADLCIVAGTISYKQAPVLKRIYAQMCEPKWVIAVGACTCTGSLYNNYCTVQGMAISFRLTCTSRGARRVLKRFLMQLSNCRIILKKESVLDRK